MYLLYAEKAVDRYNQIRTSGEDRSILPASVILTADGLASAANMVIMLLILFTSVILKRKAYFITSSIIIGIVVIAAVLYGHSIGLSEFNESHINSFLFWQAYYWPNISFGTYNAIHIIMTLFFSSSVMLVFYSVSRSSMVRGGKVMIYIVLSFAFCILIYALFEYTFDFTDFSMANGAQGIPYIELYVVAVFVVISVAITIIQHYWQRKSAIKIQALPIQ
jgi:hypothetical protein